MVVDRGRTGGKPSELSAHVARLLNDGHPVPLGFECPLFVPIAADEVNLTDARPGEGNRPWSAGAGCGALAAGLAQVARVLTEVRRRAQHPVPVSFRWRNLGLSQPGIFLWEAFITDSDKGESHVEDARAAASAFERIRLWGLGRTSAIEPRG